MVTQAARMGNPNIGNAQDSAKEFAKNLTKISERMQLIAQEFWSKQATEFKPALATPAEIGNAFFEMWVNWAKEPEKLMEAQLNYMEEYTKLLDNMHDRYVDEESKQPMFKPDLKDKRFKDEVWHHHPVFDFIKQNYLFNGAWLQKMVEQTDNLDDKKRQKLRFFTQQFIDAMSPTNFLLTNPEVLRETVESKGENLIKGLENLLKDLESSKGAFQVSMTDYKAFEVGKNLAVTPGKVIFRNSMMELIQYTPTTKEVAELPLLIIPPWINKYYILDLQAHNSFVKWAVDQGLTVFMISWVNPDREHAGKGFEDYMLEGPLAALDAIEKATGAKQISMIGYCLGGTLAASMLAYMQNKKDERIKAVTFLTTLLDFAQAGDITVFIDETQLEELERRMQETGYFDGTEMAAIFSMLRANDLIWSFVVNNYLLGKEPFPFDLLYWNSDATRLPAKMHSFYLRRMYLQNQLAKPGGISLCDVPIDLTKIKTPSLFVSTREDHIAPWKSTYTGSQFFSGPCEFVLAGSGHVAGVINPPVKIKYEYWTNGSPRDKSAEKWLDAAKRHEGSWWPYWEKWNRKFSEKSVPARAITNALEDAPGSYVKKRIV